MSIFIIRKAVEYVRFHEADKENIVQIGPEIVKFVTSFGSRVES